MRRWMWALAALVALPGTQATLLVTAVVPDLPGAAAGDEAVQVWSDVPIDFSGHRVEDGEGTMRFPDGTVLKANEPAWFTGNLTAWLSYGGGPATQWEASGRFALANEGDEVRLLGPDGEPVDAFAWGDGATGGMDGSIRHTSSGLVHQRLPDGDGWLDTDTADDWRTPRLHRIGESRLDRPTFEADRVLLYASPDSSYEVLTGLIASATTRLHLHVYEFRSLELADSLAAAKQGRPGLDLQVLVDASPVGMDDGERHATAEALRIVEDSGGVAWLADHGRYDFHHLKVLVADDAVAVQSENWVGSGVPADPSWGNRGWGAVAWDAGMADWFAHWMAADRAAWDARPFERGEFDADPRPIPRAPPRTGDYGPLLPPVEIEGPVVVQPVVCPDHCVDGDPVTGLVASARQRVRAQQLDLATTAANDLGFRAPDPLAQALAEAAGSGADVRVHYAAPFAADDTGNAEAADWLAARGVVATEFSRPGISVLHNKGIVADGAAVVGSANANHHSRSANREVALVIRSPAAAQALAQWFAADEEPPGQPRDWGTPADDLRGIPAPAPTLFAALAVAAFLRRGP